MNMLNEVDFHVHSIYSGEEQCKGFTIERIFRLAEELGIRYVGLTDHWHADTDPSIFVKERREVEKLNEAYRGRVKVFISAEIDVIDHECRLAADLDLAKKLLGYISVSLHYNPKWSGKAGYDLIEDAVSMTIRLLEEPDITVILHPHMIDVAYYAGKPVTRSAFREFIEVAVDNKKVLEIPELSMVRAYYCDVLKWLPSSEVKKQYEVFIREIVRSGCLFTLGSDAHNETRWFDNDRPWFGYLEETIALLRKYGVDESNLWLPIR
ncbi:MAG: PHP domain-containing protein [Thermoprotei archaeon]|nr:PHP domain-containing protein [Thermoprotei archaeon]